MKGQTGPKTRTKVMTVKITGKVTDWKGKFGWIEPDKPVIHPQAKMHKGQIYLSQSDVEAEISGIGARVSFFVYADGTGLGASNVRPSESITPVQHTIAKPQTPKAVPVPVGRVDTGKGAAGKGAAGKGADWQTGKGAALTGKGCAAQAGKGGGPAGNKRRLSPSMVTGQVKAWKGTFGWITPANEVNHPGYRGQIYVKTGDIPSGQPLQVGQTVRFYLYEDPQGLGAEQVTVVGGGKGAVKGGGGGGASGGAPPAKATTPAGAARPKASSGGPPAAKEPPLESGPRERVTVVPTTGEVTEWKGTYGWITAHEDVDHPASKKRGGKVYVAKKDLEGDVTSLEVGQLVQFHVFADNAGIGAEECLPF